MRDFFTYVYYRAAAEVHTRTGVSVVYCNCCKWCIVTVSKNAFIKTPNLKVLKSELGVCNG